MKPHQKKHHLYRFFIISFYHIIIGLLYCTGKQINEILLKTASEIILRIADKKNEVFLEYLKIYNFKEICSIFNIINKKKEKEKKKNRKKNRKKNKKK